MRDYHSVLSDNYRLTPEGFEFANMMLDQLDRLEEATRQRVEHEHGGELSQEDLENFDSNGYMARALAGN